MSVKEIQNAHGIPSEFLEGNGAVNKYWIEPGPYTHGRIEEDFCLKGGKNYVGQLLKCLSICGGIE